MRKGELIGLWTQETKRPPEFSHPVNFLEFCRLANVGDGNILSVREKGKGLHMNNLVLTGINSANQVKHDKSHLLRWAFACIRVRYWASQRSQEAERRLLEKLGVETDE